MSAKALKMNKNIEQIVGELKGRISEKYSVKEMRVFGSSARESLNFSSPEREMVSEYLEKARGFVSNIQEYLRQEDVSPAKR
jgi:predicted nucleotidyltransferase